MMQRALGTGDELWLGHSRSQKLDYAMPPPDVIARIKRENAMDFKLHAFALDLSLRNMADTIPKGLKAAMEEVPPNPKEQRRECLHTCAKTADTPIFRRVCAKKCDAILEGPKGHGKHKHGHA